MPQTKADDGTTLDYQDTGTPANVDGSEVILFLHEYAGSPVSWTDQVAAFKKTCRCLIPASRGYPPSDIPDRAEAYGYDIVAEDARAILDAAGVKRAHVVGLSMGAYTGLILAARHPARLASLVAASAGSGSHPPENPGYQEEGARLADEILAAGRFPADDFANGPTRLQLKRKDLPAWNKFRDELANHDIKGAAHVLRNIVSGRPSLYTFEDDFRACSTPILLMCGDEDDPVLDINLWLKRTLPRAGLSIIPKSGHLLNLEEPAAFNMRVARFHQAIVDGDWPERDMSGVGFSGVAPTNK